MDKGIIAGSLITLAIKATGLATGLLLYLYLARAMPVAEFGKYSFFVSLSILLSIVLRLGTDKLIIRIAAGANIDNNTDLIADVVNWSYKVTFVIFVVTLLCFLFVFNLVENQLYNYVICLSLAVPVAYTVVNQSVFRAHKNKYASIVPDSIGRPFITLVLSLVFVVVTGTLNYESAFVLHAFSALVVMLISFLMVNYRHSYVKKRFTASSVLNRDWTKRGSMILISNLLVLGEIQFLVVIAGVMFSDTATGIVSLTLRLSALASLLMVALNTFGAPHIARLSRASNTPQLRILVRKMTMYSCLPLLPVVVSLAFFGDKVLRLFGDEYVSGHVLFILFLIAKLVSSFFGPVGVLLTQSGHEKQVAIAYAVSCIVLFMLIVILSPQLGTLSLGVAVIGSTLVRSIMNNFSSSRHVQISTFLFSR